jgi:hypothetical protein
VETWPLLLPGESFFSQFAEAAQLRHLVLETSNISFRGQAPES